jgi:hypothetical protein
MILDLGVHKESYKSPPDIIVAVEVDSPLVLPQAEVALLHVPPGGRVHVDDNSHLEGKRLSVPIV